jgi:SAM-dependent methyltransferase
LRFWGPWMGDPPFHPPRPTGTDEIVRRHFEAAAGVYAEHVAPLFDPVAEHVAGEVAAMAAGRSDRPVVLDVGCGDGRLAARLAGSARVVAVDRSAALLRRAPAAVHRLRADAHRLPLASGGVDLAVCSMSLPFFARPDLALAEMARVVNPAGLLVLAVGDSMRWATGPACRVVRLEAGFRFTEPAALAGFLTGQVPVRDTAGSPSAAELLAARGGEVRIHHRMTVVHLRPADIGPVLSEAFPPEAGRRLP